MVWKAFEKLKEKITGKPAEAPAEEAAPKASELAKAAAKMGLPDLANAPDLKELEKKGMLGQFFRHWKNPAFLKQLQAVAARMKADGVDMKDPKAVQAWVLAHQKELESGGAGDEAAGKPQTFVKTGPELGRNDPCHCGSGKKFKKCHGA